ncbi:imm11 family protein [Aeoliella straminimaris]|uniref:imm11 family protein n=1 Tax=Aeoliella straminimaris TaxID=2954799 RepID=UPI003CC5B275
MHFYILSLATAKSTYAEFELVDRPQRAEPPKCVACGARLSNLRRLPPHRYRLKHGNHPGDLLTDGMDIAVSTRFVESYSVSGLSGLEFSDTTIELCNTALAYYMASPVCTYTLLDESASGIAINNFRGCDKCRAMSIKSIDRVVLREETWLGEDIFRTANLFGEILTSQRFVDFVYSNKFTNFQFIGQQDYHVDFGI